MRNDKELLDFLEDINAKAEYTGKCALRFSTMGRGWRLHEIGELDVECETFSSVREAIDSFMNKDLKGGK